MPVLKLQIPQEIYEQLLDVASSAWRPPVWHAEWLLRKAIQEAADKGSQEFVPAELPEHQTSMANAPAGVAAAYPAPGQEEPATARAEAGV